MQRFLRWVCLLLAVMMPAALAIAQHQHGPDFTPLSKPQPTETPGKIEVIEFFWYGCPHCKELEPSLGAWEKKLPKDVVLRREHVVWPGRKDTEMHARLFLTLRAMNLLPQHHGAVFDAIHKAKNPLRDQAQIVDWAAKNGIDRAQFEATYRSFAVNAQVARAQEMTMSYDIDGVPKLIVNGRFSVSVHGPQELSRIVDKLISEERSRKK